MQEKAGSTARQQSVVSHFYVGGNTRATLTRVNAEHREDYLFQGGS